jgi:hypothetical protein
MMLTCKLAAERRIAAAVTAWLHLHLSSNRGQVTNETQHIPNIKQTRTATLLTCLSKKMQSGWKCFTSSHACILLLHCLR